MSRATILNHARKLPRPIIIWDTETTGLSPTKNRLVEIGLMELPCTAPTSAVYSFSSLIHPPGPPPRASSRVHGITNPMLQDAPSFAAVWPAVLEYLQQVRGERGRAILVAHNLAFDLAFLTAELRRRGAPAVDCDFACSLRDVAHVVWPGEKASLSALGERLNVVNEEAHRALSDVEATAKILERADEELRRRAGARGEAVKGRGAYIRELIERAAERRAGREGRGKEKEEKLGAAGRIRMEGQGAGMLEEAYVTPTGILWHSSRACSRLDTAHAILRVTRRPREKLACDKCVVWESRAETTVSAGQTRRVSDKGKADGACQIGVPVESGTTWKEEAVPKRFSARLKQRDTSNAVQR